MHSKSVSLGMVIWIAGIATALAASTPLIAIDPGADIGDPPSNGQFFGFKEPNISGTWGWTFCVKTPIRVTHVAWYDEDADGLSHSHRIGLWKDLTGSIDWPFVGDSSEQLLYDVPPNPPFFAGAPGLTIPAGLASELDGPWRKVAIPGGPLELQPGGYALGGIDAADSTDAVWYALDPLATDGLGNYLPADNRIQIGAPGSANGFQPPSSFLLVSGVELGPMLFVEPIPEPSTWLLATLSMTYIGMHRLRNWSAA